MHERELIEGMKEEEETVEEMHERELIEGMKEDPTVPAPPGMHYDQNGVLVPIPYAPPPPHQYQGPPPPQQSQRQVTFFVSPNYRGQNPLPPHQLKQRSQRSQRSQQTFYVSSNYKGNKPKPIHVLRRSNYRRPSYPSYQPSYQQHYY